jgi:hypothetical protein
MSSEEQFSINGAAKLTGYSLPTIRKKLPALQDAGAVQIDGKWRIPLSALYACGLMSKVEGLSKPAEDPLHSETINEIVTLRLENERLRAELARADDALGIAKQALKMIEAGASAKRSRWGLFRREG